MIGRLRGRVEAIGESVLVLDVNGVGYEVQVSARTLREIELGRELLLTIDTHVREDAIKLYGFDSEVERSWFRTLQTVQGVGAKVALAVLGVLGPGGIAEAVTLGNWAALEQAPGVGKKLAQRMAAELRDKAPALSITGTGPTKIGSAPPAGNAAAEAVSALTNLGYAAGQASAAVSAALKDLGAEASTASLIRRGLRELAR